MTGTAYFEGVVAIAVCIVSSLMNTEEKASESKLLCQRPERKLSTM